jgi:hypothetical protein
MFITPSILLIALAVFCAVVMIPAILFTKEFQKVIQKMSSNYELSRISGLFGLLISFLFLSVHYKLSGGWLLVISIIGWITFIKSVIRIWFPGFCYKFTKKTILKSEGLLGVMAFVGLLFAIGLTYVALYIF